MKRLNHKRLIYVAKTSAHILSIKKNFFLKINESLSMHAKEINGNPAKGN